MKYEEFIDSLSIDNPPKIKGKNLLALWYDGRGNWDDAHKIVQDEEGKEAAWIHAYLHRKEGDDWNAAYWYRRAGKDHCKLSLEMEWEELVRFFLDNR